MLFVSGEYVRLMPNVDITKEGEEERVLAVITQVLHNLAMRVLVDGVCEPDTPNANFLDKLRAMPNMHFV